MVLGQRLLVKWCELRHSELRVGWASWQVSDILLSLPVLRVSLSGWVEDPCRVGIVLGIIACIMLVTLVLCIGAMVNHPV